MAISLFLPTWTGKPALVKCLRSYTSRTIGVEGARPIQTKLNNIWSTVKNEKLGIDETKKQYWKKILSNITSVNINDTAQIPVLLLS